MAGVAVVRSSSSSVRWIGEAVSSSKLLSTLGMASLAEWDYMPRQADAVPGVPLRSRNVLTSARLLETGETRPPDSVDESEFERSSRNSFDLRESKSPRALLFEGRQGLGSIDSQSWIKGMLHQWLQATRRAVAWNLEDISPAPEVVLFNFASPEDVKYWEVYSDSKHGGLSSATLDLTRTHRNTSGIFSGSLSADVVDEESVTLKRSGFVGMRTSDDRRRIDLEPFQALLFRVKGDGRCYISSLRTESWVTGPTDGGFNTWQAFLFAPKDEWSTIEIPLSRYLPTWRGKILPVDHEMNLRSVTGVGLSTTVEGPEEAIKGPGDFRLEIQWIKAIQKSI